MAGNTRLPSIDIERAVYPFLGEDKTVKHALKAVDSLQQAYQRAGYLTVVVDLPPQKVDGGVVALRVTEGKVGRVRVTGTRYYSLGWIKSRIASVGPGTIPRFPEVQAELGQLNRSEDLRVAPVLKPGATPGTIDVELKVGDQLPVHGDVELNDRYSSSTSHLRMAGSLRYDNLWQRDHSVALQYQLSPENMREVRLLTGTYVVPFDGGRAMTLYAVHSRSQVAIAGALTVLGNGDIFGGRYVVPLTASDALYQTMTFGLDYKRFGDDLVIGGLSTRTPIRYAPLLVQYVATTQHTSGSSRFSVGANVGMPHLFGSSVTEFANKRADASPSYVALKGEVGRTQTIGEGWTLSGKLDAQYASGPLISNEQFTAGGSDTVRGYDEAEVLGDDGMHAALELRRTLSTAWLPGAVDNLYALAFTEWATLRNKDVLSGQRSRFDIASAGVGLRLTAWKSFRFGLDVAYPLRDGTVTHAGDVRTHFNLAYGF